MKRVRGLIVVSAVTLFCAGCAGKATIDEKTESGQQILSTGSVESIEVLEPTDIPVEERDEKKPTEVPGREESEDNNNIPEKWKIPEPTVLSEKEMEQVDKVIKAYYADSVFDLISYEQLPNTKISGFFNQEEYSYAEVVGFEVILENVEPNRSIIIGSKDGWENCTVLNEGY